MRINSTNFLIGADPEGFLFDKETGRFVSAYGIIPGTKRAPVLIDGDLRTHVQVDGMALEFNTKPAGTFYSVTHIVRSFNYLITRKLRRDGHLHLKPVYQPTVEFDEEVWEATPPEAKVLGCDPDFNAWTGKKNRIPPADNKRFRTGAGHIHIGWTTNQVVDSNMKKVAAEVTKELDATLGVVSVLWDRDTKRRSLYGKAGAFRPKPYGVEYRTLSNAWVNRHDLCVTINSYIRVALENLMTSQRIASKEVVDIINKNKVDDAKAWVREHKLPPLPEDLMEEPHV